MPDEIQLPEGAERFITIRCSQCKQQKGEGNPDHCPAGVAWPGPYAPHRFRKVEFVDVSDIPAIIAQEREKWEAESRDSLEERIPDWMLSNIRDQLKADLLRELEATPKDKSWPERPLLLAGLKLEEMRQQEPERRARWMAQAKVQALAELREGLADAVADRFTYLAQHSSAPTAWYAAAQEFNVLQKAISICTANPMTGQPLCMF